MALLAYMHTHLFRWHKAYLHVSNMPVALGESVSFHLINLWEEKCQNGQKELQVLSLCCVSLISHLA